MKLYAHHFKQKRRVPVCVEARWSGYTSAQSRVVHREYFMVAREDVQRWIDNSHAHAFSDGTCNYYTIAIVARAKDTLPEILGYRELVRERFLAPPVRMEAAS